MRALNSNPEVSECWSGEMDAGLLVVWVGQYLVRRLLPNTLRLCRTHSCLLTSASRSSLQPHTLHLNIFWADEDEGDALRGEHGRWGQNKDQMLQKSVSHIVMQTEQRVSEQEGRTDGRPVDDMSVLSPVTNGVVTVCVVKDI